MLTLDAHAQQSTGKPALRRPTGLDVGAQVSSAGRSTMALGRNIDRIERNIESIESKFAKIFKRPKNREDGSDFDDFWTESIVSTQSIFSKKAPCNRRHKCFGSSPKTNVWRPKYDIVYLCYLWFVV